MGLKIKDKNYIIISVLGIIIFSLFLGQVNLFDWDEINFAESAREMLVTGDFLTVQINFEPFWEKPPLFIWMQALSMWIFGVNEFAARFPNAICGVVTLLVLYRMGKEMKNKTFGIIWVLSYACSFLPFFYFKSGIIDPWFNLFIFLGIYHATKYADKDYTGRRTRQAILSGLFIGLGTLTKGPVAILIFALVGAILLIIRKFEIKFKIKDILLFIGVLAFTGGFWFILQILTGNYHVMADFIEYQIRLFKTQDAGHGGFLLYHFVVVFLGVFPASIFALLGLRKPKSITDYEKHIRQVMIILLFTVLILFTIVKTKILHYSSLAYFPVTYLATWSIYEIVNKKHRVKWWTNVLIILVALIFAIPMFLISVFDNIKPWLLVKGRIKDVFAVANLQADVNWTGFEFIIGLVLLIGVLYYLLTIKINIKRGLLAIAISSFLYINLTLIFVITKVEGYTQRAAIDFYKSMQDADVYVETLGFKSYAHYFYTLKPKSESLESSNKDWLINGHVDKDVYFVSKNDRVENYLNKYPNLKVIGEKNGFVFITRKDVLKTDYDKE
ncbi:MAG: ArnT family glycosyltransferase [Salinivirgaceae bacterium]|nr:glycosyltransferase family 39 protein [Bacteroidales bacterium]